MSKKTKRLEKENLNLTRKQEATNKNIFQMAEERSQSQQTIDQLTRDNEKLKKLCRAMQTGGYNAGAGASNGPHGHEFDEAFEGETESEYDDEEYDEDEEAEYDDDTEDEAVDAQVSQPQTFGPPPPPPPSTQPTAGRPKVAVNGQAAARTVNGTLSTTTQTRA